MTTPTQNDWARLGSEIKADRVATGTWRVRRKLAAELGIGDETLYLIESGHKKRGEEGQPASDAMYDLVTRRIGWAPGEWRRRVGLEAAADPSSDALTLSPEHRDRLVQILRNASQGLNAVSQGLDEAIHVLGG